MSVELLKRSFKTASTFFFLACFSFALSDLYLVPLFPASISDLLIEVFSRLVWDLFFSVDP